MRAEFRLSHGYLEHQYIIYEIESRFGDDFVYQNENGNLAIRKQVLAEFRALTPEAVWSRSEKAWRTRQSGDDPNRRATE
jgi:hypothetical protein